MIILQIALSAAIVLVGVSVLTLRHQVAGLTPQPPPLPAAAGPCQCAHAKSYHTGGKGPCQELNETRSFLDAVGKPTGAHPPCRCQRYVPENQPQPAPVAAPPPPDPGQYDPAYTSWLEWWE